MQETFTFAANLEAQEERILPGTGVDAPTSDNETLCSLRLCRCGLVLRSNRRFCSHACYSASLRLPIAPRFWSHVVQGPTRESCWLWKANTVGHGNKTHPANSKHGQFTYRGEDGRQHHVYAHRFSWELARGPIPLGLNVLHRCDVPPCVNPAHLFLGTQEDNMKDAAKKRRFTVPRTVTLSLLDRLEILRTPAEPGICVRLARQYGVSKAAISIIRRGRFVGSGIQPQEERA